LTKNFEKEAVWAIISTMLDDVGPTMLDPFKQGLREYIFNLEPCENELFFDQLLAYSNND
jgi:hypothetical protein